MLIIQTVQNAQDAVLSGPLVVAVIVAAAAGALSFFSPCCLPLVPGYLSYVAGVSGAEATRVGLAKPSAPIPAGEGQRGAVTAATVTAAIAGRDQRAVRRRTLTGAVLFVLGFSVVFTSYGAVFGAFGALLIDYQGVLVRVLGAVTIVLGLWFAGVFWRVPLAGKSFRFSYRPAVGLTGAPVLGFMFGLGWTPCIGPTLAAVLTLATSSAGAGRGAVLSFAYSLGLGVPFIVAALSMQRVLRSFSWARRHAVVVMRVGGLFLVAIGVLQVTGIWAEWLVEMQGLIVGWRVPL